MTPRSLRSPWQPISGWAGRRFAAGVIPFSEPVENSKRISGKGKRSLILGDSRKGAPSAGQIRSRRGIGCGATVATIDFLAMTVAKNKTAQEGFRITSLLQKNNPPLTSRPRRASRIHIAAVRIASTRESCRSPTGAAKGLRFRMSGCPLLFDS